MILGCIADDLTGATDVALMISRQGMSTVQTIGVPSPDDDFGGADAVVVALKSRTISARVAVDLSLAAAAVLRARGARQLVFKYCSTFDSTDRGNIGPVAEALMDFVGADLTIACPAFPTAGRTVYQGHLFIDGTLLSDSPMKDHPLTPMRDANLVRLLERQTSSRIGLIALQTVDAGPEAVRDALAQARRRGERIVVVDAVRDSDLRTIGAACAGMPLITGGSGIAMGLPGNFRIPGPCAPPDAGTRFDAPRGRSVVLAGSCSAATRGQVRTAMEAGAPAFRLDPVTIASGALKPEDVVAWVVGTGSDHPPVVYSSAEPEAVSAAQQALGSKLAGDVVEALLAKVGAGLLAKGFSRFIVAGGETSGAVVVALGVRALRIGPEIDPGVPWTRSIGHPDAVLALKSGNFGSADFFLKAWSALS